MASLLFTTSNQNYMELNQELIRQLAQGQIWVENSEYADISAEQLDKLTMILRTACPEDDYPLQGQCNFYEVIGKHWYERDNRSVNPAAPIDDFFIKTSNYDTPDTHPRGKIAYLLLRKLH